MIATVLYSLATLIQIRSLSQRSDLPLRLIDSIAVPALIAHALATWLLLVTPTGIDLGIWGIANLVAFVMVIFVMIMRLTLPVHSLLLFLFPLCVVSVLAALFANTGLAPRTDLPGRLITHILTSIAAYSILMMAAFQSIMLATQERYLRVKHRFSLGRFLPPLETMESLLFRMLWTGFAILTVAIASGFLFLDNMFDQRIVHHTVLSSASWLVYVALLGGHYLFGWRGASASRWTLIAFTLLLLGYFGSKFVVEILLER
ncbi:MAG: cytochrome c biogenesis protein CcsA [Proteobacteria bacterium]|nr:cytochrome c biogenesis protein CcsA [Pseudomonadota bacterium]